jgi:hypothetical protein
MIAAGYKPCVADLGALVKLLNLMGRGIKKYLTFGDDIILC